MASELERYDGSRFCVVFVKVREHADKPADYQVRCLRGRANVEQAHVLHVEHSGGRFTVPASCYPRILENDGTPLLEDAEYYVICKVEGMEL